MVCVPSLDDESLDTTSNCDDDDDDDDGDGDTM